MAYHKSQSTSGGFGDMKSILSSNAGIISRRAHEVMAQQDTTALQGWGASIKAFESLMSPYLIDDPDYNKKKVIVMIKINKFKGHLVGSQKDRYYDAYRNWFALLCQKMVQFGAYPMTYVEEEEMGYHPEYIWEEDNV